MRNRTQKLLLTLLVLGALGGIGGWATFSAFLSTTSNPGNVFAAGTVYISDNDSGSAMYNVTNKKPGDTTSSCIKVTYGGSLDSSVKLYASSVNSFGSYVNLTITPGTGNITFPSCTGFSAASGGAIYTGTLKGFADTYTSFAAGLATNPSGQTKWASGDAVVYKFDLTLQDDNNANGGSSGALSSGSHTFTWEAQNQ